MIGIDLVPERLELAAAYGAQTVDAGSIDEIGPALRDLTGGRGPDSVVDAVGMEAHGSPVASFLQKGAGLLPEKFAVGMIEKMGVDRMAALHASIEAVRRGGKVSVVGVYGGAVDPLPMMAMFDKGIGMRMGQAHVKRWIDDIMPILMREGDPLGTETLATHHVPLEEAPAAYEMFQEKRDNVIKVVLHP